MSNWEKRVQEAADRSAREARLRGLPEEQTPEGFSPDDLHPHDLIALQALRRVAATRDGFSATLVLRSQDGTSLGDAEIACQDDAITVRLLNRHSERAPSLVIVGRQLWGDRVREALERSGRTGELVGVVLCEIDFFGSLTEFGGVTAANSIVASSVFVLHEGLRGHDHIVRISDARFGLVVNELQSPADLDLVLSRIRTGFAAAREERLGGATMSLGVTIGRVGDEADVLIQESEAALVAAQGAGGNTTVSFDEQIQQTSEHRRQLGGRLLRAFGEQTIDADYQPIVEIATGELRGFEALLRFRDALADPERSDPREILDLAGESGMLRRVEGTMVALACARLVEWGRLSTDLKLSVNLSARQLQDRRVVDLASETLDQLGVPIRCLEFEVPSSITVGVDVVTNLRCVERLVQAGFGVVIDEVGGPMTALRDLAAAGLRGVKLDRRLTATNDVWERAMVTTIIELVSSLGLDVTAVGVETPAQLQVLHAAGCRYAQGFLFAPPMSGEQAFEMLRSSIDTGALIIPS